MKALFSLVLFVILTASSAAEVRTYRITETEVPSFRYCGDLLDFNLTAHLQGTLQVTIADDNSASDSSFDLTLHNLVNTGTYDLGWQEGDALVDHLDFNPFSLHGERTQESGLDQLLLTSVEPALVDAVLSSSLSIHHTTNSSATLRLASIYWAADPDTGLADPVLDTPGMRIAGPRGGLEVHVQLVPEPSAFMLMSAGLSLMRLRRRPTVPN